MSTRGVIFVHSSPTAVCPHVEWAISGVLGARVKLEWTAQPAAPGLLRAECAWSGPAGSAGALAGALRAWPMLRFEVTEEPSPGVDGERFCTSPARAVAGRTSANGDIVVGEDQLRALLAGPRRPGGARVHKPLGTAWDAELEPFRRPATAPR